MNEFCKVNKNKNKNAIWDYFVAEINEYNREKHEKCQNKKKKMTKVENKLKHWRNKKYVNMTNKVSW